MSIFSSTQAKNDSYLGYAANWTGLIYLNVMANDVGKYSSTLYSLDSGKTSSYLTNLSHQDLARTESASTDYSAYGAKIWITSSGTVGYDVNTPIFQQKVQSLSVGEYLTDSFAYAIQLSNGALSWATTYIQF